MLFLIDSNIAIASDPLSHPLEPGASAILDFLRRAALHHHDVRTHPASLADFERIKDPQLRDARRQLFGRYEPLSSPPGISSEQESVLGKTIEGSNDAVDQALLAVVIGDAVDYLVTEDVGIHKRARRMGVADRVLLVADALAILDVLHVPLPAAPPSVRRIKVHQLNLDDSIIDGLRADYPRFHDWFRKASRSQRDALLVDGHGEHAAVTILKKEPTGEYGIAGPALKLCTFKVADDQASAPIYVC